MLLYSSSNYQPLPRANRKMFTSNLLQSRYLIIAQSQRMMFIHTWAGVCWCDDLSDILFPCIERHNKLVDPMRINPEMSSRLRLGTRCFSQMHVRRMGLGNYWKHVDETNTANPLYAHTLVLRMLGWLENPCRHGVPWRLLQLHGPIVRA